MVVGLISIVVSLLSIITPFDCAWVFPENPTFVKLSRASTIFSQKLYKQLAINRPNAVFSPFSAHVALSMAYLGARDRTAVEMRAALQLTPEIELHENYQELIGLLNKVNNITLNVANSFWANQGIVLLGDFKSVLATKYYAQAETLDFSNPNGPEKLINDWVADRTQKRILEILPRGVLSLDTSLVLVNAIFFSADWRSGFDKSLTKTRPFTKQDGVKAQVDMMTQTGDFEIKEEAIANADVLRLPYTDERFAMYILLPRTFSGLPDVEKTITDDEFNNDVLFNDYTKTKVVVSLPKFKLTSSLDLLNTLRKLGMSLAFSGAANFSGISTNETYISSVQQKAEVEVKESGTVAAAVTDVAFRFLRLSSVKLPLLPFVFNADHPFVYFIRHDASGQILFQGKLSDPEMKPVNFN